MEIKMCFVQGLVDLSLHFLMFIIYPIIIVNFLTNTTSCASMKQVQKTISQQATYNCNFYRFMKKEFRI